MKSALLAAIFGISGGVTILLAVSAEEKAPIVVKTHPEWTYDYGTPAVPQVEVVPLEEEVGVPEPLGHYSVAQGKTKTERHAQRRHTHIAPRPNFFEKLLTGFIDLQKHQTTKSFHERSHATPAARLSKKRSPRTSERFDARIAQHGKFTR